MGVFASEQRIFAPRHVLGWTLFTLTSGFINAGAVMACKSFVTHITGNVTNLALDAPRASAYVFLGASFIGGAMVAVLIGEMSRSKPKAGFGIPLVLSFATLVGIAIAGKAGIFGSFGVADGNNQRAFVMLGLLGAVMGMVNAAIATATSNKVRVTHLTGPATDLAGNIIRAALGSGMGHAAELRWATLRAVKLAAFAVGAGLAVRFASRLEYDLFAVAGGILVVALGLTGAPESADASKEAAEAGDDKAAKRIAAANVTTLPAGDRTRTSARDERHDTPLQFIGPRRRDAEERDAAE
ncbi:MAG: hypothetical protein BGO98_06000 [Myxococcales bacterium 68-20]|nr:MAG: hypothetical protein BGO98_06000 [Myxococcales bacterium 68-20]